MTIESLSYAINVLAPGRAYSLSGETLEDLVWLDDPSARPDDDIVRALADNVAANGRPPASISDRQFFQQLAVEGIISESDALASNAAVIPQPLLEVVEALPPQQHFSAKMLLAGGTSFERNHPLTIAIGAARGMKAEQIDEFFRKAGRL